MAYFSGTLGGLRLSLFANALRSGLEVSLPSAPLRALTRRRADSPTPVTRPPLAAAAIGPQGRILAERTRGIVWYHTIDLGHGVVTPGFYDHRPYLRQYRLQASLAGRRVLDVATFDGFWAFEFERRGAAKVVALDVERVKDIDIAPARRRTLTQEELDRPMGRGFHVAHEALGSKVERVVCNVYDLSPERLGTFDVVHCGDLLLHLQNPMRALQNICAVTEDHAIISDCFWPDLDRLSPAMAMEYQGGRGENIWWKLGRNTLQQMILDAGFARVDVINTFRYGPAGEPATMWHVVFKAYKNA